MIPTALALTFRPGAELPEDGQWVFALHEAVSGFRRWMAGRFNLHRTDRELHREYLGLSTPGATEAWSRVVVWAPLPEPAEVPA